MYVHILVLVGFRSKLSILWNWVYNYFTYDRAINLIIRPYERKTGEMMIEPAWEEEIKKTE